MREPEPWWRSAVRGGPWCGSYYYAPVSVRDWSGSRDRYSRVSFRLVRRAA